MVSERISEKVALLPSFPGVYIMRDKSGEVIYVGKAKRLKNRVKSYFDGSAKTVKTHALVSNVEDFEYILTNSELDAFSLESNLIKKYKPKYNILLKDDKSFPYIKINLKERFPRVMVVRRPKKDGSLLFGPYVTGLRISEIMKLIKWAYPVRWCSTNFDNGKMRSRPCLHGEIGNCLAPCCYQSREEEYLETIKQVIKFLNGDHKDIKKRLTDKMNVFAQRMQFEEALETRNLIEAVDKMDSELITSLATDSSIDVFAFASSDELSAINVMKLRNGKNIGQFNYLLENAVGTKSELISSFISSYYETEIDIPKEIILESELKEEQALIESYLQEKFNKKISVLFPVKGIKKQLLENSMRNAEEYAYRSRDKFEREKMLTTDALKELAEIVKTQKINRIEGFDISNISGTNSVASMVVFENGVPAKKEYRKFKIKTIEGADDFASMNETLNRRIQNLKEKQKNFDVRPDLIIIDGGKGQLSSAEKAIKDAGENIPIISIAKKQEEIFTTWSNEPIVLDRSDYALRLVQRVRDESHRFAVNYHRNLRGQSLTSFLLKMPGLGQKTSEKIWKYFKTKENIFNAKPEDFEKVEGVSVKKAIEIYNFLRNETK